MRKPQLGDAVAFFDHHGAGPEPATVERIWSDTCVNLRLESGETVTSVLIVQDGADRPTGYFCEYPVIETDFGGALAALKAGKAVRRAPWHPDTRIILVEGGEFTVDESLGNPLLAHLKPGTSVRSTSEIVMINGASSELTGWAVPHSDLLATDWVIL